MASFMFTPAKVAFAKGQEAWDTNTYKVALVTASYVASTAHQYASVFSGFELSGTGYAAGFGGSGRKTLTGASVVSNDASVRAELVGPSTTWTTISAGCAAACVILRELTSDGLSPLIAFIDTGGFPVNTNGGDFAIKFRISGTLQLT